MKTITDPSTKPYFKCFSCPKFRKECGGIPTRGMTLKEWCEYMRDVKVFARLTNQYISTTAEVSSTTVERVLALNDDQDIMRATARRIELAVIGPVTNYLCCIDFDNSVSAELIATLQTEVADLRAELARKNKIIDKFLG